MSEYMTVQAPMLRYAEQIGWMYVSSGEAMQMRSGDTGLYFAYLTSQKNGWGEGDL